MDKLINLISGRFLKPVWGFLDGKKTALASGAGILAGLASFTAQLVPLLSEHNTAGLISLAKGLPSDPSYLLIVASLGALGIGHKLDKAAEASKE